MYTDYMLSPLGLMEFKASDKGITQIIFCGDKNRQTQVNTNHITELCKQELTEYFDGKLKTFTVPLDQKGTEFQKSVWQCLTKIPFGETLSYGDIAISLNNPKSVRAVGGANGRNPISIIVPCHRVIGATGTLTGYAGGIERKLWLLKHEGIKIKNAKINDRLDIKNVLHKRQDKTQFLK
ncbi:methylated-DNA--[protein]-cysteine S-methyltransferase [Pseudoalteromonas denitrificans]|uniref:Methylated-DNA--protein-cysteine methyltransferase n=1 Tax=Pseudoalteromonas denitrificans DSM 6059 TaxID=1123010 RepID=A0A1I1MXI2_9GAMM|nr:methylated-DNA--[protein]-cysteine S-methyltransferase [Pseudoalteromonas denitrificans]SFC89885.1 methylated-DNA-[protein]-cysteine S-methyltransferase [Pseudoalteromonas denitrificans DSM 6059]